MRIFRLSLSRTMLAICAAVIVLAGAALADTVPPGQVTLPFLANQGTASGFFVYNPTTNSITDWNFSLSAAAGDFATVYNKADTAAGATAGVLSNANGDQVFSFIEIENAGTANEFTGEFDIVMSCGGVANCVQQAAIGTSFAIVSGAAPNCNPTNQSPLCIASGEQDVFGFAQKTRQLAPGFFNVADPPGGTLAFNMDQVATGTIFTGSTGGGGGTSVPEPSMFLLLGSSLGGLALRQLKARQ